MHAVIRSYSGRGAKESLHQQSQRVQDFPIRRHIKAGSYVSTCLHSGQAKSRACRNIGCGSSCGEGALEIGITSPQYEQLTVTYHLSGSTLTPKRSSAA